MLPLQIRAINRIIISFIAGFTKEELEGTNDQIKRALSLNNASPTGILKFRIAQAVKKFGKNPNDTGSAAVQGK